MSLKQQLVHTWKVRPLNCSLKGYWNNRTSTGDPWASPWSRWWWHHPRPDIPVREWISLNLFFWDYIHTCSQSAHQVFQQWRLPLFYRENRGNSNCSSQPRTTTFGSLPELQLNDKLSYRFLCHFGLDYSSLCVFFQRCLGVRIWGTKSSRSRWP